MVIEKNDIYVESCVVRTNGNRKFWLRFSLFIFLIALPIGTYFTTTWYLGAENHKLANMVDRQSKSLVSLDTEVDRLEQLSRNSLLASEIDKNSLEQLRKEMVQSQAQMDSLNEKIQFYQSLMDSDPEKAGVYIETLDLEAVDDRGGYHFNIVVAQRSANHQRIKGRVSLELIDDTDTEAIKTLSLAELTGQKAFLTLGFKFFQQLHGEISLPNDFNPAKVRVWVRLDGDTTPRVDQTYAWET